MNQQELLQYAIQGLEAERAKIDDLLTELKAQVHGAAPRAAAVASHKSTGRTLSAKGRANIRAALKRRWEAFHEGKKAAPKKKRTLSPAQLAAMRKNAAKARAAALKKAQSA